MSLVLNSPLNVHWELTNECNYSCVHCYQKNDNCRLTLDKESMVSIANNIVNADVFQVSLSGGEPFLVDCLYDIISILKNAHIEVVICSNGSMITSQDIEMLKEYMIPIQVSLDSSRRSEHNAIRNSSSSFDDVICNIKRMLAADIEVSVSLCANTLNYMDIDSMMSLCHCIGVRTLAIGEMLPIRGKFDENLILKGKDYVEFINQAKIAKEKWQNKVNLVLNTNWGFLYDSSIIHVPCTALDRDFAILYDGNVSPCPFVRNPDFYLGNATIESLKDIWIKSKESLFYKYKFSGCSTEICEHYSICMSGCKAEAINNNLSLSDRDIRCLKLVEKSTML